jgi:hypothetical protein
VCESRNWGAGGKEILKERLVGGCGEKKKTEPGISWSDTEREKEMHDN